MRKLLLLSLLFIGCNNAPNSSESKAMESRTEYFYDTLEEAAKGYLLDYSGRYNERIAFIDSNRSDIEDSFQIRETITVAEKYNFVFVDFFIGADRFRETIEIKEGFEGKFWPFEYFSCYDLPCDEDLNDKIEDWEEDSIQQYLYPFD